MRLEQTGRVADNPTTKEGELLRIIIVSPHSQLQQAVSDPAVVKFCLYDRIIFY